MTDQDHVPEDDRMPEFLRSIIVDSDRDPVGTELDRYSTAGGPPDDGTEDHDAGDPLPPPRTPRIPPGRRTILIVALVAIVMAAAGFLAATLVISPEDAAARATPPAAGPVTVPVEFKRLDSVVLTRGDIGFSESAEVKLAGASGSSLVVTGRIPEVGTVVTTGSVLLEVIGRPVLALIGGLPTYRNLSPGSSGPDVEQLETALAGLGIDPGPQDKLYDSATGLAVATLYRNLGYEPPPAGAEVQAALAAAESVVTGATQSQADAQKALDKAAAGPNRSTRLSLQGAIDQAKAELDRARTTPTEPDAAAVAGATARADAARAAHDSVTGQVQAATAAGADTSSLLAALEAARQAVDDATSAVQQASAPGPPGRSAIAAAQTQLDVAIAQRDEAVEVDTSLEHVALTAADGQLSTATAALAAAQAAAVTPLPAQEVVWLADLPRRVDEVLVTRGATISGPVLRVSAADLAVQVKVTALEAGLLTIGMPAELTVPGGAPISALISAIGGATGSPATTTSATSAAPGDPTSVGPRDATRQVILQPQNVGPDQARTLRGTNVRVKIPVASTSGEVLVVPVAALFSDSTGTPRVEVMTTDGQTTRLQTVQVGLSSNGEAEVRPINADGAITPAGPKTVEKGTLVVVGR